MLRRRRCVFIRAGRDCNIPLLRSFRRAEAEPSRKRLKNIFRKSFWRCVRDGAWSAKAGREMAEDPEAAKPGEARYANYFSVGHTAFEVIIEFGQFYRGDQQPQTHTRIVTSPGYANRLLALLGDSLERYETSFGPIPKEETHE